MSDRPDTRGIADALFDATISFTFVLLLYLAFVSGDDRGAASADRRATSLEGIARGGRPLDGIARGGRPLEASPAAEGRSP
jgi:hypothetical protein